MSFTLSLLIQERNQYVSIKFLILKNLFFIRLHIFVKLLHFTKKKDWMHFFKKI